MEDAIKRLVTELGASSGAIMVVDSEANLLRCGASYNMPDVWVQLTNRIENNPDNTNGRVAYSGNAEILNNLNIQFHGHPIGSVIVVPIKDSGRVIGNIEIISNPQDKIFTKEDQTILENEAETTFLPLLNNTV